MQVCVDCDVCWELVWNMVDIVLFTGYGILYITFISPLHHHYNIKWNKIEEDCFITFNVYVLNKVAKMYKI